MAIKQNKNLETKNFQCSPPSDEHKSINLGGIEWRTSIEPIDYPDAIDIMENRVEAIYEQTAPEMVWLLEHPPVYTAGTGAKMEDLLQTNTFPVYETGRGGQYTYHGPGQRVIYVMLDLRKREADLKNYVRKLESWVIATLAQFKILGERRAGRVGIWVFDQNIKEKKIAAIGIRIRHWISFHGISINLNPELNHYNGIIPCGISDYGVTSLHELGKNINTAELDHALKETFCEIFKVS